MLRVLLAPALLGALLAAGCSNASSPARAPAAASDGDVLATVNGAPLREADVRHRLKTESHVQDMKPEYLPNVLEALVTQELAAQQAEALGLDQDERYQQGLKPLQAQVHAYRRKELAERFYQREVASRATPSEAEVRAFYDAHASEVRSELHVLQILRTTDLAITQAQAQLQQGQSFEDVAQTAVSTPGAAVAPWDLGTLKWLQVPPEWREPLAKMKPGDVSGVIRGPKDRAWIIKLVERRDNPAITFEAARTMLTNQLMMARMESLRTQVDKDLRAKAAVVMPPRPAK